MQVALDASDKCINVNVGVNLRERDRITPSVSLEVVLRSDFRNKTNA